MMDLNVFIAALAGLLMAAVLFLTIKIRRLRAKAKAKAERELASRKHQKMLDHQLNLGRRLYKTLITAALSNREADKVAVQVIEQNGSLGYSVIVGWREASSFTLGGLNYRGYPIVQININLGRIFPINVSLGPYPNPTDNTYREFTSDEESVRSMITRLKAYIADYSPHKTVTEYRDTL